MAEGYQESTKYMINMFIIIVNNISYLLLLLLLFYCYFIDKHSSKGVSGVSIHGSFCPKVFIKKN
jgi:hypothetical protein